MVTAKYHFSLTFTFDFRNPTSSFILETHHDVL